MQEMRQYCDEHFKEMEQKYDRQYKELKKDMKGLRDMVKEVIKHHNFQLISQEEDSVEQNTLSTAESSQEPGNDNGGFASSSECSTQTGNTNGVKKNDHVVDNSLGKL